MDSVMNLKDPAQALDLARIRYQLIRLEDTIAFHLIERAQFPLNKSIYEAAAVPIGDSSLESWLSGLFRRQPRTLSFMEWYLRQQEALQSRIRRYDSPDEVPFFPDAVRPPVLRPLNYPAILHRNDVVVNERIRQYYVDELLPAVCPDFGHGDRGETQENYGSSATCDIACLQALSRRIHFGKFVAEAKFRAEPERFTRLIRAADRHGLGEAIVNKRVEQLVLQRLRRKVETYGQDLSAEPGSPDAPVAPSKINVDAVVDMYEKFVIPLTKDVEVEYLMQRLDDDHADLATASSTQSTKAALRAPADNIAWALAVGGGALLLSLSAIRWLPTRK